MQPSRAPEAPNAPTASAATETSLTVSWNEPVNTNPTITRHYVHYRAMDEKSWSNHYHPTPATTATVKDLTAGTAYQLRVSAKNAEGSSPWSAWGEGSTQ